MLQVASQALAPANALHHIEVAERNALRHALHSPPKTSNKRLYEMARIEPIAKRLKRLRKAAIGRFGKSTRIEAIQVTRSLVTKNGKSSKSRYILS